MKNIITILLSLTLVGSLSAQTEEVDSTSWMKFGIRFIFDGFRPSGGLGAKLWLSETSAITLGLTGRISTENEPGYASRSEYFTLILGYEKHVRVFKHLNAFGLVTPSIGLNRSKYESFSYSYDDRYWTLSVGVGWGVEYWVTRDVSFSASQTFNYSYQYYIDEDKRRQTGNILASYLFICLYF